MKSLGLVKAVAIVVATTGVCVPQALMAAESVARQPIAADVALRDGGVLLGQVVDTQGTAKAGVAVTVHSGDRELAAAKTDAGGYFAFRGLGGGVYRLSAAEGQGLYRVWAPETAPASAGQGALIVAGQDLVRGDFGPGGEVIGWTKFCLSNPWVMAGLVAAAVAIPLALHEADDEDEPASP